MNLADVIELLKTHQNERGIANWQKLDNTAGLSSFGIGLTKLRQLSKQIGRDHDLALELWHSDVYDAKVIGLLIDEPKKVTPEQAEQQVEGLGRGLLTHVFSSCDATLAKTSFALELSQQWWQHNDPVRRRCAYGLLYEQSKKKGAKAPSDEFFINCINRINDNIDDEVISVRAAMGGALMGIGKRNVTLNTAAISVAKRVGPINFEQSGGSCEPLNVLKHLTSDYLNNKFNR